MRRQTRSRRRHDRAGNLRTRRTWSASSPRRPSGATITSTPQSTSPLWGCHFEVRPDMGSSRSRPSASAGTDLTPRGLRPPPPLRSRRGGGPERSEGPGVRLARAMCRQSRDPAPRHGGASRIPARGFIGSAGADPHRRHSGPRSHQSPAAPRTWWQGVRPPPLELLPRAEDRPPIGAPTGSPQVRGVPVARGGSDGR